MGFGSGDFIKTYIRHNWLIYTMVLIFFIVGVSFGALGVRDMNAEQAKTLGDGLEVFLSKVDKASINNWSMALDIIGKNLTIILGIYVLGLTIVGVPGIMIIIFSRGFRIGFTVGFLVRAKAARGVLLSLMSVIPHNLVYIPVFIVGAAVSVAFSLSLIRGRFGYRGISLPGNFIRYSAVMAVLVLLLVCGGLIESYLTPTLVKMATAYIK